MTDPDTGFPDGKQQTVKKTQMHISLTSVALAGTEHAFSITWHSSSCGAALL